ncbi:hypothetical protein N658DRAFT_499850 [Parathielavia hyrcaniae]|uniref:Azaphilone pigments biosynthesis cluster protein L N-terminal domain-containing protein n=1 Tax=Parathielavia hyrcaniae TaxID=113614 RepID=A0AAN6PVT4_9PEZI|nr:hypothetical protein N658DRAFT_499850 [Parathielavia hyrcaniae]
MDPLSVTASVITVATIALQSVKALYDVIDGLVDAPHSVSQSKSLLSQTQTTLGTLRRTLETNSASDAVDSVLEEIELSKALESTQSLCQDFATTLTRFTSHSTDLRFSTRDRVIVQFNESKIKRLNRDLADCQRTITMVFSSVTLIVSNQTSGNIDQLRSQFDTQERALADLGVQLSTRAAGSQANDDGTAGDGNSSAQLTASLQEVCQKTLSATRSRRTGQKFGAMQTDNDSIAMQGIVGLAQPGVDQTFGSLTTTNNSRAFQGQMEANSFDKLFGK